MHALEDLYQHEKISQRISVKAKLLLRTASYKYAPNWCEVRGRMRATKLATNVCPPGRKISASKTGTPGAVKLTFLVLDAHESRLREPLTPKPRTDSLPHGLGPKIVDSFWQNFSWFTFNKPDKRDAKQFQNPAVRSRVYHKSLPIGNVAALIDVVIF